VRWNHRKSVTCVVAALGVGLTLGACSSGGGTTGVPSANDQPLAQSAPTIALPTESPSESSPAPSSSPTPTKTVRPSASSAIATRPATYTFPVIGTNSYAHTHHDYQATDIITHCGNRVVAVTNGTILDVTLVDKWKASVNAGATRGGLSVSMLGDDGVRYYGSHLSVINADIRRGARVTTGHPIGKIGETGDASACHLHFGISPPCARVGDWWTQRGAIYPWPYLDAWRKGSNKSAVAAVHAWQATHGCPKKPLTDP
jgi:murein DD-endopeptidase MepM/ murein hydrolase activator NlpD